MLGDPTIPRSRTLAEAGPRKRKAFCRVGWFARDSSGVLYLESQRGNRWALDFVSILQGTWGSVDNAEGTTKLPRPREYDAEGNVEVEGDRVVIDYLEGDPRMPIVRGGVRGVRASDFFPYNQTVSTDYNRLGGRLCPLDAGGKAAGVVEWEAAYDDGANVRLSVIAAGDAPVPGVPPAGARTYLSMEAEGGIQAQTAGGETLRLAEGQIAMVTALGHTILIDPENGIQIAQAKPPAVPGGPPEAEAVLQLKDGTIQILGTTAVQLLASSIELGNGVVPPTDKYILSSAFMADLSLVMAEIAVAVTIPVGAATLTTQMATDLAASVAVGPPFLSSLVKGQ